MTQGAAMAGCAIVPASNVYLCCAPSFLTELAWLALPLVDGAFLLHTVNDGTSPSRVRRFGQ
jgi:hypothetical protein